MIETWRPIEGFNGAYQISNHGRVKNVTRNRILRLEITYRGYCRIMLSKQNVTSRYFVHRLVAGAFLMNPENKAIVNHKDGNKQNNRLENLEWATASENTQHYYAVIKPAIRMPEPEYVFAADDLPDL